MGDKIEKKNVVVVYTDTVDADMRVADGLMRELRAHDHVTVVDARTPGTEKARVSEEFKKAEFYVILWSDAAKRDTRFCLTALQAEREQVEKRRIKCINVRLEAGIKIQHIKQKVKILEWTDKEDTRGLAKTLVDVMNDPRNLVTERMGNISEGLVWNYFVVYLKTLLPVIRQGVIEYKTKDGNQGKKIADTFFLVIPKSGNTPAKMADAKNMQELCDSEGDPLLSLSVNDAGMKRTFNPTVHKARLTQESQDWYYFPGEFSNPVATIHKLYAEYNKIDEEERDQLIHRFTHRLQYILNHRDTGLAGTYTVIEYDDISPDARPLNEMLVAAVRENLNC